MKRICQAFMLGLSTLIAFVIISNNVAGENVTFKEGIYWVLLESKSLENPIRVSERSLDRRQARSNMEAQSWYDYPVDPEYIAEIIETGAKIRHVSRWLNAVSVAANEKMLNDISKLQYIKEIKRVSSFANPKIDDQPTLSPAGKITTFDYGLSYNQIAMLGVDSLHDSGYSGAGVLIGIIDTGFDTSHVAFSNIVSENRIVATYDFINGDFDVMDDPGAQRSHGTGVFSVMAGFDEGSLIGPAFGAEFVLAKTEIVSEEIQAEEDNWVAAIEWMDSLGVDIVSSSLGYIDWYDTTQLDGQTALCTIAADIAASMGIIVVNAAGNEGNTSWRKVIPPADGDSVIAAGGVNPDGIILSLSSRGPTADGRIKPDFCAQGSSVYMARSGGGYLSRNGTSFAAPLIAGSIALILEGHPSWTLAEILEHIKSYSTRVPFISHIGPQLIAIGDTLNINITVDLGPNNDYGWGIPDYFSVMNLSPNWAGNEITLTASDLPLNSTFEDSLNGRGLFEFYPDFSQIGEDTVFFASSNSIYSDTEVVRIHIFEGFEPLGAIIAPHPAVDSAVFRITPNAEGFGKIFVHNVSGIIVRKMEFQTSGSNFVRQVWDGKNEAGKNVASGIYILNLSMNGSSITQKFFFVSSR